MSRDSGPPTCSQARGPQSPREAGRGGSRHPGQALSEEILGTSSNRAHTRAACATLWGPGRGCLHPEPLAWLERGPTGPATAGMGPGPLGLLLAGRHFPRAWTLGGQTSSSPRSSLLQTWRPTEAGLSWVDTPLLWELGSGGWGRTYSANSGTASDNSGPWLLRALVCSGGRLIWGTRTECTRTHRALAAAVWWAPNPTTAMHPATASSPQRPHL